MFLTLGEQMTRRTHLQHNLSWFLIGFDCAEDVGFLHSGSHIRVFVPLLERDLFILPIHESGQ